MPAGARDPAPGPAPWRPRARPRAETVRGRDGLLIVNARPWSGAPLAGADAIAVRGGRVLAVGAEPEVAAAAGPDAERVDARGATVTPGLVDAHLHLLAWARSLEEVALDDAASAAAVAERVARAAARGPGVVVGRGWAPHAWPDRPHRALLDRAAPGRVVLLHSRDFHAMWVSGAALAAAGITRDTPDPPGGVIERDAAGEPTGVLREHAVRGAAALDRDRPLGEETLTRAIRRLHAAGITAVHDFEGPEALQRLSLRARDGGPRVRVLMHLAHAHLDQALALGLASGIGDDSFRIGAVKLFADGTLGSRTAAMLEPYEGGGSGLDLMSAEELSATVARALGGGLAVAIHAIGDRATRRALDAFEAAGAALRRPRLPSRIEHLQLVADGDVARLVRLGVAASMQPQHAISDLDLAERAWGARCARAYAWRTFRDAGAMPAFGSDAPVEPPDPAAGLRAAVTRARSDGTPPGGWHPAQRLSLDEALTCYTSVPARLAGDDPARGTLRPGAPAELVVWNADLHALDPMDLGSAAPALTMLDGEVVHRAPPGTSRSGGAHRPTREEPWTATP